MEPSSTRIAAPASFLLEPKGLVAASPILSDLEARLEQTPWELAKT